MKENWEGFIGEFRKGKERGKLVQLFIASKIKENNFKNLLMAYCYIQKLVNLSTLIRGMSYNHWWQQRSTIGENFKKQNTIEYSVLYMTYIYHPTLPLRLWHQESRKISMASGDRFIQGSSVFPLKIRQMNIWPHSNVENKYGT